MSNILPRMGLGTVQLGMSYGATNRHQPPSIDESREILRLAADAGMRLIDTAPAYGNSEQVLGTCGKDWEAYDSLSIVTKTLPLESSRATDKDTQQMVETFERSLERLRRDSIYALLVHRADDLLAEDSDLLLEALLDLKKRGLAQKIGASVYTAQQIDNLLAHSTVDLIQLPLNVLDQRLVRSGHLERLRQRGVEIHARSIFLQGILLADPAELDPYFQSITPLLTEFRRSVAESSMSVLQAAIAFCAGCGQVDRFIIGVAAADELRQFIEAVRQLPTVEFDFSRFACEDPAILDPSQWVLGGD